MSRGKTFFTAALVALALLGAGFLVGGQSSGAASTSLVPASQANPQMPTLHPTVGTAVQFDISPPLRSIAPVKDAGQARPDLHDLGPIPAGPAGVVVNDPVVQKLPPPPMIPTPIVSFNGPPNLCGGCAPPDPNGEVGPNHVVVMDNLHFQIFNKTGTSVFGPAANNTLWSGFGGACQTRNDGDPVVLYDQLADRWLLTQFTSSAPYFNCVALSTTNDPTGTYYRWAFPVGGTANFGDYPKYGMWPNAYFISTREFLNGSSFVGVGAYALNRAQLLAGNPNPTVISFLAPPSPAYTVGDGLLPADLDGTTLPPAGSPEYFVGSMDNNGPYGAPQDALTVWKFVADFVTPGNSSFTLANTLPTAPFNSVLALCGTGRACIPQLGTTNRLDHQGYRQRPLFRLAYRNMGTHESLVTNQSVSAGTGPTGEVSGIRWWEIRSPNSSPVIFQEGTYAPGLTDGIHRWMGSIAMDRQGNMALGYSASGATMFPSIYYTGRLAGDPAGQMPQGEAAIVNGTGSQTGGQNRWGDYTDMTVDPADDCTFWYVNEYIPTTSAAGWQIRVGAFKLPGCAAVPTPTVTGTPPTATRTATQTSTPTATPTSCTAGPIESFETGLGTYASSVGTCVPGGCGWASVTTAAHTGTHSAFAPDLANISDQYLSTVAAVSVPSGATLSFWNSWNLESGFDGGVLEFSTNGGTTWADAGAAILTNGYNGTISTGFQSPIAGRQAWTGNPNGTNFVQTTVSLSAFVGQNLLIRFREANDSSVATTGWWVDDVSIVVGCPTSTVQPTSTAEPTATICPITFSDVPFGSTFYEFIRCLACRGIINGYADGTFKPNNNVTRGQLSKIVSNSAGFNDPQSTQMFQDVPVGSTFFDFVGRLASRGYIGGYACGGSGEPCLPPGNLPYFRPNANATRGQISKIVSNAAGFIEPVTGQTFQDVAPGSTFYDFVERLVSRGVMSGYPCGGTGEPCVPPENRPYFRPNRNATRGQTSKIVSNTFFPGCVTPARR